MNILLKDFLSVEDVAKYFEEVGYSYDLDMKYESQRLLLDIYDLINQSKIAAVFHHYGKISKEIELFDIDEDSRGNPIKIPLYKENNTMTADGYFYIEKEYLKDLLLNEMDVKVDRYIGKYGETVSISEGENIFYHLDDIVKISIRDVRIPRRELDTLFEERLSHMGKIGNHKILQGSPKTDKQIIDELQAQIIKLNSEKENLTLQSEQRISTSLDDEPIHHKSVGSMQVLVTTLIKMAEYDKEHLADPYGELNKLIQAKAEVLGLSVKKDFIAKWLKKADEVL